MKIKFVTSRIPDSCIEVHNLDDSCPGLALAPEYYCQYAGLHIYPNDPLVERPLWCPLVLESEETNV